MFTNKYYKSNVITLSLLMQIFVFTKLSLQVYYDQLQWQCLIVSLPSTLVAIPLFYISHTHPTLF